MGNLTGKEVAQMHKGLCNAVMVKIRCRCITG